MDNDKILELARRHGDHSVADVDWSFYEPDLIAFAHALLEAERQEKAELIAAAKAAVVSCWRLDTDITEEIAALRKLLEGLKEKAE